MEHSRRRTGAEDDKQVWSRTVDLKDSEARSQFTEKINFNLITAGTLARQDTTEVT